MTQEAFRNQTDDRVLRKELHNRWANIGRRKEIEGLSAKELRMRSDRLLEEVGNEEIYPIIQNQGDWLNIFGRVPGFEKIVYERSQIIADTCTGQIGKKGAEFEFDLCIVDEASKATPMEASVPMSLAKKTILVGDSRQLAPFKQSLSENLSLIHI